uniref:Uncharacterized protein n=1 Tax=Arundo donax TaxID=35708 RepID=A0A0A9DN14_ARUDO
MSIGDSVSTLDHYNFRCILFLIACQFDLFMKSYNCNLSNMFPTTRDSLDNLSYPYLIAGHGTSQGVRGY